MRESQSILSHSRWSQVFLSPLRILYNKPVEFHLYSTFVLRVIFMSVCSHIVLECHGDNVKTHNVSTTSTQTCKHMFPYSILHHHHLISVKTSDGEAKKWLYETAPPLYTYCKHGLTEPETSPLELATRM